VALAGTGKAIHSSEMSVLTRATRRNIPEYGILNKLLFNILVDYLNILRVNIWIG
jgi:hypothetical protein